MWEVQVAYCETELYVCRARHESGARKALGEGVLQQVEQTDLMSYGLIPEFVGRFPIITALHVSIIQQLCFTNWSACSTRTSMSWEESCGLCRTLLICRQHLDCAKYAIRVHERETALCSACHMACMPPLA